MSNPNGTPETLVPSHPGNVHAGRHGLRSKSGRMLAPRAKEIADALMSLPHVGGVDVLAAEEIGSVIAALEAIDLELAAHGTKTTTRKWLMEHKARLSRELRAWVKEFGATPRSRADWARALPEREATDELLAQAMLGIVSDFTADRTREIADDADGL